MRENSKGKKYSVRGYDSWYTKYIYNRIGWCGLLNPLVQDGCRAGLGLGGIQWMDRRPIDGIDTSEGK